MKWIVNVKYMFHADIIWILHIRFLVLILMIFIGQDADICEKPTQSHNSSFCGEVPITLSAYFLRLRLSALGNRTCDHRKGFNAFKK